MSLPPIGDTLSAVFLHHRNCYHTVSYNLAMFKRSTVLFGAITIMNILVHVNVNLSSLRGATGMHGLFVVTTLILNPP